MKKLFVVLAAVCFIQMAFGQGFRVNQSNYQKISVSFFPGEITVDNVKVPEGEFSMLSLPDYGQSYVPGAPQLPQFSRLMEVPVCDSVIVRVVNAEYRDYTAQELGINHPLFPVQYSVAKSGPRPDFVQDQQIYSTDAFYALPLAWVEAAGIRRSAALVTVHVSPIQYNPVSQIVRVYTRLDVEYTFANADMSKTSALKKNASPMFSLGENLLLNQMPQSRDEINSLPIKYIILGNPMFADNTDLADFVAWKRRLGYMVEVYYTNDPQVGTSTTTIKNFIQGKYDNATAADPAPTYLLFLGDREQFPAFNTQESGKSHITDLYYATLAGNDFLPDCYYGRLSATNNDELSHQIEKIMMYEQFTMPDPSYLGNAVLIAGTDDFHGPKEADGQVNYITTYYMNEDNPRYTNVMAHLYNCSSQAAQIRSEVSDGAGWVNYTAHGSETSWAEPEFNVGHVAQLQNTDKYGLMIGNCCVSGHFNTSVCFGEALLRAEKKGAMGYIGASNNTYWGEDYYWAVGYRSNVTAHPTYTASALGMYDKLFHTHNEDYSVWASTIGGIMTAGNMSVQATSSDSKRYYWEIYHCFGDPSVRVYLGIPSTMEIFAGSAIVIGTSQYEASELPPYAYVALTQNGEYVAASFADAQGNATLTLPEDLNVGSHELVVLAQNFEPYFQDVTVISSGGPYVIPTTVEAAENTNYRQGNTVKMNISVFNAGTTAANGVYAKLVPVDPVVMQQDSVYIGQMAANGTQDLSNAFSFVMPEAQDYELFKFKLYLHWIDTTIVRDVKVRALLPKVYLTSYNTTMNNVEVLTYEPGNVVSFNFENRNAGHAAVGMGTVDLTSNYSGVQVVSTSSSINGLAPLTNSTNSFEVNFLDTVPASSIVNLYYHTVYDDVHRIDTLTVLVGIPSDNFETGDFSKNEWSMGDRPWVIAATGAHTGNYCARSANNMYDNSQSKMTISVVTEHPSTLSYYRKVSSEENYDKFKFYIDNREKDVASGEEDWTQKSFDVNAGNHTFVFSYEKDYSTQSGRDCAWIDDVILPYYAIAVIEDDPDDVGVHVYPEIRASVYPNPTTQWVNVESESPVGKVVLFDLNGRVVRTMDGGGDTHCQLNINDVPVGMYMLQVSFGDRQTRNFKIIKR